MSSKVTLTSAVFNDVTRRQLKSGFVSRQATDFKNLTKRRMIESVPAGAFYGRSKKSDVASRRLGHRASAKGQRPAIDTGNLLSAVTEGRISEDVAEVFIAPQTNALNRTPADRYAEILQTKLDRPIMSTGDAAEAQRKIVREGEELADRFVKDVA